VAALAAPAHAQEALPAAPPAAEPAPAAPPAPAASEPAAAPPESGMVEEVIVTARRREESQESVPVSVTAFNARQLERAEVRDLADLKGLAPNVIIEWVGVSPLGAAVFIRGVGSSEYEKSFDPAVAVMQDGVYLGTATGALLYNFDLEAVEVLRGPQGSLFGRNASGGVINVRRRKPTGELGLRGSVTVGSWGRHDYKLTGDFPIVKGVLAGKLSFVSTNVRGLYENEVSGEVLPDSHYLSGAADLLYTPREDLSFHLKYERARDREQAYPPQNASDETDLICLGPQQLPASFLIEPQCADPEQGRFTVRGDFRNDMAFDLDAVTLNSTWTRGAYRLISVSGYRGFDEDVFQDLDGTAAAFFSVRNSQRYDQVSEELRLEGQLAERVGMVAGLFYFYGHYDQDGTTFFLYDQPFLQDIPRAALGIGFGPGLVRVQDVGQSTHSAAAFANVDVDVFDRLRASAGARYTYERKSYYTNWGYSNHLDSAEARRVEAADVEPVVYGKRHWARVSPRASIDYTLDDRVLARGDEAMLYGSYAQGFRSGGFSTRADPADNRSYRPEIVHQYEVGLKTQWRERRLVANVAAFHSDYRDKQEEIMVASPTAGQQILVQNAARARIRGLEVELSAMPLHGLTSLAGDLRLWAHAGFLQAEYQRFVVDFNPFPPSTDDPRNHPRLDLRFAPRHQVAVGIDSPWQLGDDFRLTGAVQYRARSTYRNNYTVDAEDNIDRRGVLPAIAQLDASLSFEALDFLQGSWRLTAIGRNVLGTTERIFYVDARNLFALQAYSLPAQWAVELAATY
jgi:iron complex outermembrane receptor protein